ncbi:MAG: S-layer homology domain-containing protein, partial [Candidatus Liptonbacteria bacterium]
MALALITVLPMNEVAMARISAGSTQMQVGRYSQPATTSRISAGNVITNRAISRVGGGCSILPGGYCYNSSTNRLSAGTTFYGGSAPSDSAIRGGSTTTVRTTSRIPASGVSSMPLSERITAGTLNPVGAGMIIAPINRITASGSSTGSSGGHINASGTSTGTSGGRITASGSGTGTSGGRIVAGGSTSGSTSGGRIVAGGSTTGSTSGGRIVAGGSTTGTTSDGRIVASGNGTTPGGGCSTLPGGYCYNPTQPDNRIVASGSGGTTVSQGDSNRINASGTNNPHISLCNDRPYPDDVDAHWSEIYVRRLYDLCVVEGYSDGTFRPEQEVTRAELTKMALFAKGVSPYDCDDLYCDTPFADLDAWQGP